MSLPAYKDVEHECPFTNKDVLKAYGEEVNLFLHVHMRGYDRTGEGLTMDASYYDKYGAPVNQEDSWLEGYHSIEKELSKHFNQCVNTDLNFPLVAGMAGGAHLYKPVGHGAEPWNWTGWVPRKKVWCTFNKFHMNRHFLNIRGNEIQNNLWDYHPFSEQGGQNFDDEYHQIVPMDHYRGGYWLPGHPWGRYIHLICLKSHNKVLGINARYNFIVHPLAYRMSINDTPDNSVDATQWQILNIKDDGNFKDETKWGTCVHGLEIFNDFTYYYSWTAKEKGIEIHNGTLMNYDTTLEKYIYWFDTYPLEFGEFLLETSLERGVYFHTLAANDAYYGAGTTPPYMYSDEPVECGDDAKDTEDMRKASEDLKKVWLVDPKGNVLKTCIDAKPIPPRAYNMKVKKMEEEIKKTNNHDLLSMLTFLKTRPYHVNTIFGHTAMIDTKQQLESIMADKDPLNDTLGTAETTVLKYLYSGRFFSHTGVYDIFNYGDKSKQIVPFMIANQHSKSHQPPQPDTPCYDMTEDMEMIFTFPPVKEERMNLVWRYTLQYISKKGQTEEDNELETVHGYFKMNSSLYTRLNLTDHYDKKKVKWIYFTAFRPDNPQRRAWFNAIRGAAFGDRIPNVEKDKKRTHRIVLTKTRKVTGPTVGEMDEVREASTPFTPNVCSTAPKDNDVEKAKLQFFFNKCTPEQEDNIYAYNMQAIGHQADLRPENSGTQATARDPKTGDFYLPPRYLQNINGYFRLNQLFPTKLNLGKQWDPRTVNNFEVSFYCINGKTGQVSNIDDSIKPKVEMPTGCEV